MKWPLPLPRAVGNPPPSSRVSLLLERLLAAPSPLARSPSLVVVFPSFVSLLGVSQQQVSPPVGLKVVERFFAGAWKYGARLRVMHLIRRPGSVNLKAPLLRETRWNSV